MTSGPEPLSKGKAGSIQWSARAMRDLEEIAAYIARDNPRAARKWSAKLRKTAEGAAKGISAARSAVFRRLAIHLRAAFGLSRAM